MNPRASDFGYLLAMIALTVYGQIIFKWRMQSFGPLPAGPLAKFKSLLPLMIDPAIVSGFASAFLASLCWMVVLTRMPLSYAYPFTALTFVFVVVSGAMLFDERVGTMQLIGLGLVVLGLIVGSRT